MVKESKNKKKEFKEESSNTENNKVGNEEEDVIAEERDITSEKSKEEPKKKKSRKAKKESIALEELKIKHAELNDKFLRLFSEFDNFRKRTFKEKIELTTTASEGIIIQLLPILDDFDRALKAFGENNSEDSLLEGINLIHNKLKSTLKARGLEAMESIGEEFNTDFHEAITKAPAPSKSMKGKIIDEIEQGYLLGDKVIRYAKVVVGS